MLSIFAKADRFRSSSNLGEGREGEASENSRQERRGFPHPSPPPVWGRGFQRMPLEGQVQTWFHRSIGLSLLLLLAACAYPTRNQQATVIDETYGYRWNNLAPSDLDDTLVIVTASGGGTRATALALSVLRGLDDIALGNGETLAQEVDVISSVSGGSVAAGYFALAGRDGFDTLENDFVRKNGMTPLILGLVNPVSLARLSTPSEERIDLLIDYLNKQLFHDATY